MTRILVPTPTASPSVPATTAPAEQTQVESQQITPAEEIAHETQERLNPTTKTGLGEDVRLASYDKQRLVSAQQTTQTTLSIQRAQAAAQQTAATISTTDAPVNKVAAILAQKAAIPSQKVKYVQGEG